MRVPTAVMSVLSLALGAFGCSSGGGGGSTGPITPQTSLAVTLPTATLTSGQPVQAVATFVTGSTSVPATSVHWSSDNSFIAAVDNNGLITGARVGEARISASSDGKTATVPVIVIPGSPAAVVVFTGNNQTTTAGSSLPEPLCTNVKDAAGNLIVGAVVTYTITTGGGYLWDPRAVATDGAGIATSGKWVLGSEAGTQTVTATSPGATPIVFTATAR